MSDADSDLESDSESSFTDSSDDDASSNISAMDSDELLELKETLDRLSDTKPPEKPVIGSKNYPDLSRRFLRLEYPGKVENLNRMMETLGGQDNFEIAVGTPNKRIEVRFRPEDQFCKACLGDKSMRPGILLKVKRRRPVVDPDKPSCSKDSDNEAKVIIDYEVVGLASMSIKFNRLCDFQYLPMIPKEDDDISNGKFDYIYKDIFPDKLPTYDWLISEKSKNMPYFFLPPIFSRFDTLQHRLDIGTKLSKKPPHLGAVIARRLLKQREKNAAKAKKFTKNVIMKKKRNVRKGHTIFVNFKVKHVPTEPSPAAVKTFNTRGQQNDLLSKLKELFEKRPIWSKVALQHLSGISNDKIKYLLPMVAYYFQTGPWRIMWVKYGYDPRKLPEARIYQTFDFRIRTIGGLKLKVQAKRSYSSKTGQFRHGSNVKKFSLKGDLTKKVPQNVLTESHYILRPGVIPPARQMFYQYCDIYIPEIQEMLARLPDVEPKAKCHAKNGWLPNSFHDQCREIASRYVSEHVQKEIRLEKQKKKGKEENKTEETDSKKIVEPTLNLLDGINIDSDSDDNENLNQSKLPRNSAEAGVSGKKCTFKNKIENSLKNNEESDDSDEEIDMDIVQEINKFIELSKKGKSK